MRVPSEHPETVRVKFVPELALGVKEHPVAVPAFEKSDAATVLTFCEKESAYVMLERVFVGELCEEVKEVMLGALR